MSLKSRYVFGFPGSPVFRSSELAFVDVLGIERDGLGYDEVTGTPVGRQCRYDSSNGSFNFDTSIFTGTFSPIRYVPERILVIYQ